MVRPVQDLARAIEQQDIKTMSTLPGIGAATAESICAKLRRKMPKFALMVPRGDTPENMTQVERDIVEETYQILMKLGHSEPEARSLLEAPLASKKKFKDVDALFQAVYDNTEE